MNKRNLLSLCLWIAVTHVIAACGETHVDLPDASVAGSSAPLPMDDHVNHCDQAIDGTECGESGREMHCVFGVCAKNICGDGVTAGDEQCDDGDDENGDGCSTRCKVEALAEICGNRRADGEEECDDGNGIDDDLCSNACTLNVCRNGRQDPGEECDDGNRTNNDDCSNNCKLNACGNTRVDDSEECDDGNQIDDDACSNECTNNICGNRRLDPGEVCDGDMIEGLACDSSCNGRGEDQCLTCMSERCAESYGYDVFTSCRVAVKPEQVSNPVVDFVGKCTTLDECVRRNDCYNPDLGTIECFCGGGVNPAACQAGDEVRGPCIAETLTATACAANDPACVIGLLQDLTLPSGFANYLAECRYLECAEACDR